MKNEAGLLPLFTKLVNVLTETISSQFSLYSSRPFLHNSACTHHDHFFTIQPVLITIQSAPISSRFSLRPFHHDSVCAHFITIQSAPISSRFSLRPFHHDSVCAHFITIQSAPISSRFSLRPFHHDSVCAHFITTQCSPCTSHVSAPPHSGLVKCRRSHHCCTPRLLSQPSSIQRSKHWKQTQGMHGQHLQPGLLSALGTLCTIASHSQVYELPWLK